MKSKGTPPPAVKSLRLLADRPFDVALLWTYGPQHALGKKMKSKVTPPSAVKSLRLLADRPFDVDLLGTYGLQHALGKK